MEDTRTQREPDPRYVDLLGKEQAQQLLGLFVAIDAGKYDKGEVHKVHVRGLAHPVRLRAIRADMQSFVNTFIDPYLKPEPYLPAARFVIDAGANIGYTAVLFANWWPECRIISIEPDGENHALATLNAAPYPNITMVHGALWNKTAQLRIEAGQEDGFVVREMPPGADQVRPENLTTGISVDQLLAEYGAERIDLLKMNIEGSEKEVFSEGYQGWLPKTRAMLIELHDGKNAGCSKAVFSAISNYDLAVAETAPYGVLFIEAPFYRERYARWYKEEIYTPNVNKERFPHFYLDQE